MIRISTHILDISQGQPAANVQVMLENYGADGTWIEIGGASTDGDGRIKEFAPAKDLELGTYRLTFDTGAYFVSLHLQPFFPQVIVMFEAKDSNAQYHIPLLLSPFGYSTYRGR